MVVIIVIIVMTNNDKNDEDTFSRKPYKSGNSQVITVSGIPPLSSSDKVFVKQVELDGVECILCLPFEQISEYGEI